MNDLGFAIFLATTAHVQQVDKAGAPYILHPLRVMFALPDDQTLRIVGVLHDVVEDTHVKLGSLASNGFESEVVEALDAISRRDGEPYDNFIRRVSRNQIARTVKRVDIIDNLRPERITQLDPATQDRLRSRYLKALRLLEAAQ